MKLSRSDLKTVLLSITTFVGVFTPIVIGGHIFPTTVEVLMTATTAGLSAVSLVLHIGNGGTNPPAN